MDHLHAVQAELAALAARYARAHPGRWVRVPAELDRAIEGDAGLRRAAYAARVGLVSGLSLRLGRLDPRYLEAVLEVPRERFVLPEDIAHSADDAPMPLDPDGLATVSAPHAYLLTFALLGLGRDDHLLELGTGTGYGAALASTIVGKRGHVTTVEIDADLHERAARLLAGEPGVTPLLGDARELGPALLRDAREGGPRKVAVTYALFETPEALLAALPEGGRLVAPVGAEDEQQLVLWERKEQALLRSEHGAVRYVAERGT
jgi:protein-L-isoaspartate(D-aspartate) O-methyltransferase